MTRVDSPSGFLVLNQLYLDRIYLIMYLVLQCPARRIGEPKEAWMCRRRGVPRTIM
ncbi:hypothetical protein B0O80DRAFT_454798 [Mortierella sp. GBAus27b]|nr:hypothetical protein B0O80DRAFT_454798 [Mortierella sp. GBAus27b]